jgi:hypothetical protein
MIIFVTADHIKRGRIASARNCPVALAMKDAGFSFASVGLSQCGGLTKDDVFLQFDVPPVVLAFIETFEERKPVEPFAFELGEPLTSIP